MNQSTQKIRRMNWMNIINQCKIHLEAYEQLNAPAVMQPTECSCLWYGRSPKRKLVVQQQLSEIAIIRRSDRMKGLLWIGNGFLLLYKMFEAGSLSWPRTTQEAAELTEEQFNYLMLGLNPLDPKIKEIYPEHAQYLLCKTEDF